MATNLTTPITIGRYTHMVPDEIAIWERWLAGEGADLGPYDYDVQVGDPIQLPLGASDLEMNVAKALTRKRIDAISYDARSTTIYEVKKRAGLSTVGQIKGYAFLWRNEHPDNVPLHLIIVTDSTSAQTREYATAEGVQIKELP
jgi:hypothetical protein